MRHGWSVIILQIQPVRYDGRQSLAQDCQAERETMEGKKSKNQWGELDEHREARNGRQPLAEHDVVRWTHYLTTPVSRNSLIWHFLLWYYEKKKISQRGLTEVDLIMEGQIIVFLKRKSKWNDNYSDLKSTPETGQLSLSESLTMVVMVKSKPWIVPSDHHFTKMCCGFFILIRYDY